jgi:hypothetical protein
VEAARRVAAKMAAGEALSSYGYGELPLREEVLERIVDDRGKLIGAVTQNRYGALVLNSAGAMFVDIDFPPVTFGQAWRDWWDRLWGRKAVPPEERREAAALEQVERLLNEHGDWGVRVYRTFAGLRLLFTQGLFEPSGGEALAVMQQLKADPLYVRLCRTQECFRARLTPKPWRCGMDACPVTWPRETAESQAAFERWQAEYTERQRPFATCRFVRTMGNGAVDVEVARIVELHDRLTRCEERLELA